MIPNFVNVALPDVEGERRGAETIGGRGGGGGG
jgi:hypothetical protein